MKGRGVEDSQLKHSANDLYYSTNEIKHSKITKLKLTTKTYSACACTQQYTIPSVTCAIPQNALDSVVNGFTIHYGVSARARRSSR